MGHHHHAGHDHHHHGDPQSQGKAFVIAIALNSVFVVAEFIFGFLANSTALMADAGHNLSDVLGLVLAWSAVLLSRRVPSQRFTFGLRASSILAALGNAMLLLLACGAIGWEAIERSFNPPEVGGMTVIAVAGVGIVVNGYSALLFMRGQKHDINVRGAWLHMAADTAVSLGVVLSGVLILFTQWYWIDPLISLVIVAVILFGTLGLFKESLQLALNAVPPHIDPEKVTDYLQHQPGVREVRDLHIWGMSTTESALTAHLVMPDGYPGDQTMAAIRQGLEQEFGIAHSTLQIELGNTNHSCSLHVHPH
ncbi:Cobalt-zinc-cadmium resistance protein CzcD [Marinobacterium lacunae]|uniref:Cobalt-zinc-cadmium resistance protein CzcD n=1 Tax=Marinobacterium lacunae TaxID=1232683 RepID=A0A081FVH0_9GAMM|nr:cation diffusion facilitator family transporter [Marinobacterium lacunae]KEA62525.1 Cobalt-zinc-cadmium resistance protein CzcD [Marinobacterium lacunae]MBR9885186.1 cation transporter [Oceanospirillales bacterium]